MGAAARCGFTLIEILVVVADHRRRVRRRAAHRSISTGRDRDLETESDRLYTLFNYAREQAELQTREYGMLFA